VFCLYSKANINEDTISINKSIETGRGLMDSNPDSAFMILSSSLNFSNNIRYIYGIAFSSRSIGFLYYNSGEIDSALKYFDISLRNYELIENEVGMSYIYFGKASLYSDVGESIKAFDNYHNSLGLATKNNDIALVSKCYNNLGLLYMELGFYPKAIESYFNAIENRDFLRDSSGLSETYMNMGNLYRTQGNYIKANEYFSKSIQMLPKAESKELLGDRYLNIGLTKYDEKKFNEAEHFYKFALQIYTDLSNEEKIGLVLGNIAQIKQDQTKFDTALIMFNRILSIFHNAEDYKTECIVLNNIGNVHHDMGNYKEGVNYSLRSLKIANEYELIEDKMNAYKNLHDCYFHLKKYVEAYKYHNLFKQVSDSIYNNDITKEIAHIEAQKTISKKEDEMVAERKNQRFYSFLLICGLVLFAVITLLIFRSYNIKRKANVLLTEKNTQIQIQKNGLASLNEELFEKNEAITQQRDQIQEQHEIVIQQKKDITDSITYASRIQQAMLPSEKVLKEFTSDYFIFYQPRDIVSGDFYWIRKHNNYTIVIAADCTGHGVPGAFMSILCISLLNELNATDSFINAAQIIDLMRDKIKTTLNQTGKEGEAKDGMDMSVCMFSKSDKIVHVAGAYNPVIQITPNSLGQMELIQHIADRQPVAIHIKEKSFTNTQIDYKVGDRYYLFSDGYPDQSGWKDDSKFKTKNFKNLLLNTSNLNMTDQKLEIDSTIKNWMGDTEQRDDMLVIGLIL